MPEQPTPKSPLDDVQEAAQRSQDAGIADESAAYEQASETSPENGENGEAAAHPS